MKNIYTSLVIEYVRPDVLKSLQPACDVDCLPLPAAAELIENIAYQKVGYQTYEITNKIITGYAKSASDSQLVGQWARCALYACVDPNAFHHADIRLLVEGFPSKNSMSASHVKLEYLDHVVFEGSAWDLMMDMLIVPQMADQTNRLSQSIIKWLKNGHNHGLVEMPKASSAIKLQHLWDSIVSRTEEISHMFSAQNTQKLSFRTSLCDVMPHFFTSEELVVQITASALWQHWVKYTALTNPSGLGKIASAIIGAPLDTAIKKQIGGHLKSIVDTEVLKRALKDFPPQTVIQGLWKSYFAFADGCGITPETAIDLHKENFKAALVNNVTSTLVMDRYLPLFKKTPGFEDAFLEMPFALWKKNKMLKSVPAGKSWGILQKHDIIPQTLRWEMVEEELKHLTKYTDEEQAQHMLNSLVQNHRLRQEIMNTVASEVQTAPTRRRM